MTIIINLYSKKVFLYRNELIIIYFLFQVVAFIICGLHGLRNVENFLNEKHQLSKGKNNLNCSQYAVRINYN